MAKLSFLKNINNKHYQNEVKNVLNNHFEISRELQNVIGYLFTKKGKEKYLQFFGIVTELLNTQDIKASENMNYEELKLKLLGLINEM